MTASLVWIKTGDEYPLKVISPVFLEWLVSELDTNNQFLIVNDSDADCLITSLNDALVKVNIFWKTYFKQSFFEDNNLHDQKVLNQLHKEWVLIQQQHTGLVNLLYKVNPDVLQNFLSINKLLHKLEQSWSWEFEVPRWNVTNPWDCQFNIWQHANLSLDYGNLGRSAWEKFTTWGEIDNEYNQLTTISARIHVNFSRPREINPSKEFRDWCASKEILCYSDKIPLGNFVDLENKQANYKKSFLSNVKIKENYLTIKI